MKKLFVFLMLFGYLQAQDIKALLDSIEQNIDAQTSTSALKLFSKTSKSPVLVKSYNQKDLEKHADLYDFLRFVPGFKIEEDRRNLKYIQVRSNSHNTFNNKILVLINGHRIADELGGDTSLDLVPIHAIKRLEIVRGPGSVLYGPNAFAAVISIITYDGNAYKDDQIEISFGNDQQKKLQIEKFISGKSHSSYLAYSIWNEGGDNYPSADGVSANGHGIPYANLQFPKNNNDTRMVYKKLENYQLKNQKNSFLSYTTYKDWDFTFGTMDASRNKTYKRGLDQEVYYKTTYNYLGVTHNQSLSPNLDLRFKSKVSNQRLIYKENGFDPLESLFSDWEFLAQSKSRGIDYEFQFTLRASEKQHIIFGMQKDKISFQRDLLDITLRNGFKLPNLIWPLKTSVTTTAYYFQSLYEVNRKLSVLSSIRKNLNSIYGSNSSPRFAINYDLGKNNFLKVSHGTAFRYPTGQEAYYLDANLLAQWNDGLLPEKVKGLDLSIQRILDDKGSEVTLSYYRQKISNFMALIDVGPVDRVLNEEALMSKGFEFDLQIQHSDSLSYFINGSYLKFYRDLGPKDSEDEWIKNGRVESGDFTHSTLSHMLSFGLDLEISEDIRFYSSSKYVGEQRNRFDARYAYPFMGGYTVHNMGLSFKVKSGDYLRLSVNNAFNKKYNFPDYDISSTKVYSYPKGRSLILSYKFRF
ncbi:TonB-dependent receptor [bacterium]|nr:TonB-dependent receptor [bacterium]